jgi:hypothetical protein
MLAHAAARRRFAIIAAAVLVGLSLSCYNPFTPPPSQPSPGDHQLAVAFQHWFQPGFCSAACVSMWTKFLNRPGEQDEIDNWVASNYPYEWGIDGSFSPEAMRYALAQFAGIATDDHFYVGEPEKRQALADIKKGLAFNTPTTLITEAQLHAKLVVGGSWTELSTLQPSLDYVTIADPEYYTTRQDTIAMFLTTDAVGDSSGSWIRTISKAGQVNSATAELSDYDAWGGTYYGDPTPPPPPGDGDCGTGCHTGTDVLYPNNSWDSPDGNVHLIYQLDGNFVLYNHNWTPLWATNTFVSPGWVVMQGDGNLAIYGSNGAPVWSASTEGHLGAYLVVNNNGDVSIYTSYGAPLWSTNTAGQAARFDFRRSLALLRGIAGSVLHSLHPSLDRTGLRSVATSRILTTQTLTSGYNSLAPTARTANSAVPGRQENDPIRRQIFVPKPYAVRTDDVLANLMAGLQQSHLGMVRGWETLNARVGSGRLTATSVERVSSLSRHPEYWLITLRSDGQPYARVMLDNMGWILSAMRATAKDTRFEPQTTDWAYATAARYGYINASIRRLHMFNNLTETSGVSDFDPFFEVISAGRMPAYLSQDGDMYVLDANGKGSALWLDGLHHFSKLPRR